MLPESHPVIASGPTVSSGQLVDRAAVALEARGLRHCAQALRGAVAGLMSDRQEALDRAERAEAQLAFVDADHGHKEAGLVDALRVMEARAEKAEVRELEKFQPTAEQVNALPERVRRYVLELEARCDPAGDVSALMLTRDQNAGLQKLLEEARASAADENIALRPEVRRFAEEMERKLRKHDATKGPAGWKGDDPGALMGRVHEEAFALGRAIYFGDSVEDALHKAADVANMAMMVADVCGGLAAKEAPDA